MDISIVIVNYNTKDLTRQTIESIYNYKHNVSFEVFLVDNNSSDNTVEHINELFPQVITIKNHENQGFSKANNIAVRKAQGKYILLLNSDTVIEYDTLDVMYKYMEENLDVGAVGCKVVLPDGSLDKACKRSFPTPTNSLYKMLSLDKLFPKSHSFASYNLTYLDENKTWEVDALVGAFMFVRSTTIEEIGLLDEDFFMYGEDIDWCYRIKESGWRVIYNPETKITHHKGGSSKKKPVKIIYEFHRAMYLFYKKHYKSKYSIFTTALVYTGIWGKMLATLAFNYLKALKVSKGIGGDILDKRESKST